MITVILLCWKRFEHFEDILKFWLNQDEVKQIIVFDNSGQFKTELPVQVVNISENLGPSVRLMAAYYAKYDYIIFCDDDLSPRKGIIDDLIAHFDNNRIVGIMGKRFTGETYVGSPTLDGRKLKKPVEVDYVPYNLCLTHRDNCLVDIRKCPDWKVDDFWWEEELKRANPRISLWVAPTKNFAFYPESSDKHAICKNPAVIEAREEYFKKWVKGKNEIHH